MEWGVFTQAIKELLESQLIWAVGAIWSILYIKKLFEKSVEEAKSELKKERESSKEERERSYEVMNSFARAIQGLSQRVGGVEGDLKEVKEKLDKLI